MGVASIRMSEKEVARLLKIPGVQDAINSVSDIILDVCGRDTKILIHLIPLLGGKLVCTEVFPIPTRDQLLEIDQRTNNVIRGYKN